MLPDKSPVEPAHPMIVDLHDNLIAIYKLIREKYQTKIDAAFDEVSRQIGFVVTTTIPADIEVGDNRKLKQISVGAENLKGTLFEKIAAAVGTSDTLPSNVAAGKYSIYLLWYPALKLRLRTDFMEPAHFAGVREPAHVGPGGLFGSIQAELSTRFVGKVSGFGEPAHWFDPGRAIIAEEAVLIHAIDEVYPELRLAERISVGRQAARGAFRPEVHEPAHFRQVGKALESPNAGEFAADLAALLRRHGF
jgi:hypothetical protein